MEEELLSKAVDLVEFIEEQRDDWQGSRLQPLIEETYEVLEQLISRLEN